MISPGSPVRGIVAALIFLAVGSANAAASLAVPVWTGSDRFGDIFAGFEFGQTSPFDSILRGSGEYSDQRWLEASIDEPAWEQWRTLCVPMPRRQMAG